MSTQPPIKRSDVDAERCKYMDALRVAEQAVRPDPGHEFAALNERERLTKFEWAEMEARVLKGTFEDLRELYREQEAAKLAAAQWALAESQAESARQSAKAAKVGYILAGVIAVLTLAQVIVAVLKH